MVTDELSPLGFIVVFDQLLFTVQTVPLLLHHQTSLQSPEPPDVLSTAPDHLLQEVTGELQLSQGGQVKVGEDQGDHTWRQHLHHLTIILKKVSCSHVSSPCLEGKVR